MKYNFDKEFDRSNNYTRKWDKNLIKEKMGVYENVIPMDIADLDFEVAPEIKEKLIEIAKTGDYNYSYVTDKYYDTIIRWHKKRFDIDVLKEDIKLAFGTCSVLHYIIQCFCEKGDGVLINIPCYEPFVLATTRNGAKPVFNELKIRHSRYYIDFEKLEEKLKVCKVYILCSPQNPSGRIWGKEELEKIVGLCNKYNVLLVSDEVHRDILRKGNKFTSILNLTDNAIVCSSPNKSFNLGGLKGSYVIIKNKEIRKKFFNHLEKVYVTSPHIFMQFAHIVAYSKCDKWLEKLNDYIDKNFEIFEEYMRKNFPDVKIMKAESSFLSWVCMKKIFKNEDSMREFFKKIKVIPVYGSYFQMKKDDCWVRFNLGCTRKTLYEFLKRLDILKDNLKLT